MENQNQFDKLSETMKKLLQVKKEEVKEQEKIWEKEHQGKKKSTK